MESKVTIKHHSVHKMLVVFPVGLLVTAVLFDVIQFITGNTVWADRALVTLGVGIVGGFLAAPFGWLDWSKIPSKTRAKDIGLMHGIGNVFVLIFFSLSWVLRWAALSEAGIAIGQALSFAGVLLLAGTAWLGGELVDRYGISVSSNVQVYPPTAREPKKAA